MKHGNLSIESENIFPVIKKWLYTEQDIFFRELISNASDAITKLKKMAEMGKCELESYVPRIEVRVNTQEGTIKFIDNGIGMTAEEVDQYINQIAFSGATDFINQYKGQTDDKQIIGHFGLGFYSAFMISDHVTISTLSWQPGAEPVYWDCDGNMKYSMEKGTRTEVGSEMTLYVDPKSKFLNPATAEKIIRKYFEFLPIEIHLTDDTPAEVDENGKEKPRVIDRIVNDTTPLWTKKPEDCTPEEYTKFYRRAFGDYNDPAYWIHLYDEELGIRGIVFLKSEKTMEHTVDGLIKLYNNQVFVADNVKEVIPDFLLLQYGVIDCSDLPLMVSRSNLHADERIGKIEHYITEQIAFKLYGLFECEREKYEEMWPAINPFMKYSCLKNKLFSSYVNKFVLFQTLNGKYVTLKEHLEEIKDKHPNRIYYVSDEIGQAQFIKIYQQAGMDALMMTHVIDSPYIRKEEMQSKVQSKSEEEMLRFDRIDAAFCEAMQDTSVTFTEEQRENLKTQLTELFEKHVKKFTSELQVEPLVCTETAAGIMLDEEERRAKETIELYGAQGMDISGFKEQKATLLINYNNRLVKLLLNEPDNELVPLICNQLYDLGRLGQESLEAEDMVDFIERSNKLLHMISLGE